MLILEATKCMDTTLNGRERKHPYQAGDTTNIVIGQSAHNHHAKNNSARSETDKTEPQGITCYGCFIGISLGASVGRTDKLKKTFYIISS